MSLTTLVMNSFACVTRLERTSAFAFTTSCHDASFGWIFRVDLCTIHRVLTAVPRLCSVILHEDIFATPTETGVRSLSRTRSSSPTLISGSQLSTPTASVLALFVLMACAATSSIMTQPLLACDAIAAAPDGLHRNLSPVVMLNLEAPMTSPPTITSSMRSMSGALLRRTMTLSGIASSPDPSPNCLSMSALIRTKSDSNAGRASPGGVILTCLVLPEQMLQDSCSRTGTLHLSHQRRCIFPRWTAPTVLRRAWPYYRLSSGRFWNNSGGDEPRGGAPAIIASYM